MDQSDRYANLNLTEKQLIEGGRHVLCAYIMKPKEGFGNYLADGGAFRGGILHRNQCRGLHDRRFHPRRRCAGL